MSAELYLAVLKTLGILLTGVFGVMGAWVPFKDKDGVPTRLGRMNMAALGIALSVAVTIQVVDFVQQSRKSATSAQRAADAAARLEKILDRVDRVADPLGRFRIRFEVSVPLDQVSELKSYQERLEAMPLTSDVNGDDDDPASSAISLCRTCESFPSSIDESAAVALLTRRVSVAIFFYRRPEEDRPIDVPKTDPNLSILVGGAPELDEGAVASYSRRTKRVYLFSPMEQIRLEDCYHDEEMNSVPDLVGARMVIEIRADANVPREMPNLEWLNIELPGARELNMVADRFQRIASPDGAVYFAYDFPDTYEALKRSFAP